MPAAKRLTLFLLLILSAAAAPAHAQGLVGDPKQDFARLKQSSSLFWDAMVIDAYSRSAEPDVFIKLAEAYLAPPSQPQKQIKELLAGALGQRAESRAPSEREAKALTAFVKRVVSANKDIWASYNGFYALRDHSLGEKTLMAVLLEGFPVLQRAAALEALGRSKQQRWLEKVPSWVDAALAHRNPSRKAILLEALCWASARRSRSFFARSAKLDEMSLAQFKNRERARLALAAVIKVLEQGHLPHRSRREVLRALQYCFESKTAPDDPEFWRARLAGRKIKASTTVQRRVRFMSVASSGKRFVFVLDASDSMLKPLTERERRALRGLLPKPKAKTGPEATKERNSDPFKRVKTRFDAARVHVIHSLRNMERRHSFAVVLFGSSTQLFTGKQGFVRATPKNVQRICQALSTIAIGKATQMRPHGTLLGNTNLYKALHTAFQIGPQGLITDDSLKAQETLIMVGADTVFLLSDGRPIEDGFRGLTPPIKRQVRVGGGGGGGNMRYDPETGTVVGKPSGMPRPARPGKPVTVNTPIETETGPYILQRPLVREIKRLNLLRRVVIHVVSLGEAGDELPRALAKAGGGQYRRVG